MAQDQEIQDGDGKPISIGTKVLFEDRAGIDLVARVRKISDYDVDYDDNLGRPELYPPKVTIQFDDDGSELEVSTHDVTPISIQDYPGGPEVRIFEALELVVAT